MTAFDEDQPPEVVAPASRGVLDDGYREASSSAERLFLALNRLSSTEGTDRTEALSQIVPHIRNASSVDFLLHLSDHFEKAYVEETNGPLVVIKTPEILALRAAVAERCRHIQANHTAVLEVLQRYVVDVLPDTYPDPAFNQQGPEWTAPSKWKVRIQAAYSLGIVGNAGCLRVLRRAFDLEPVPLVRTALALSHAALTHSQPASLRSYLTAYETRQKDVALAALAELVSTGDTAIDAEIARLRRGVMRS
ncbi:MAG: hypothetical protein LC667_07315 [Thioalkalivibrio sp.]|nr:hypothetical protein [Thioalkalivibrio sp.]